MVDQNFLIIAAVVSAFVAVLTAWREKLSVPALAFSAGMLLFGCEIGLALYAWNNPDRTSPQRLQWLPLALAPSVWVIFSLTYSRGNRRALLRSWAPIILGLFAIAVGTVTFLADRLVVDTSAGERLALAGRVVHVVMVLASTAVLMNLERTFRASVGVMRWQIKFMVLGVATLFVVRVYTSTQALVFSAFDLRFHFYHALALMVCSVLAFVSVTRRQGFKLDLYPSPTLVYRSLTVFAVGAYLVLVGFLAHLARLFGGGTGFALQALLLLVAFVVLAVALLSDRARIVVKRFVSLHLRRPTYDVRNVWRQFTEHTSTQVTETELSRAASKWISETFDILSVSVWLLNPTTNRLILGASTALTDEDGHKVSAELEASALPLEKLRSAERGINIDAHNDPALEPFRKLQPIKFENGGHRTVIPVMANNEIVAVIILGDRVRGFPLSMEELDLLRCIASQMASDLLRLRLSERLLQSKQIEAFQTMATFFVHDLKNTAWTLSLLVQNLRTHFDNPGFREEAVSALAKSVGRINDLIGRIGSLREEFRINAARGDLNSLVTDVVKEFNGATDISVESALTPLPETMLDVDQVQRVVRNLILNAKEASKPGDRIEIQTQQENGFAVLTVRDYGSGMSEEFLRTQLFRPFATTKKKGIGIGMFQSKMIVEAHRGRMLVESKQGQGTTFRVLLPIVNG